MSSRSQGVITHLPSILGLGDIEYNEHIAFAFVDLYRISSIESFIKPNGIRSEF